MNIKLSGVVLLACLLSACSGGSNGSGDGTTGPDQMPGGVYFGTLSSDQSPANTPSSNVIGIITESGHAKFVRVDNTAAPFPATAPGAVYALSDIAPVSSTFSGSYAAYAQNGLLFPNGTGTESGTISNGGLATHYLLLGDYASATNDDTGEFGLGYSQADYEQPAPLNTIVGTYGFTYADASGTMQTASISMDQNGGITGPADTAGCTYSGTLQVPDATYNAYAGSITQACGQTSVTYDTVGFYIPANSTNSVSGNTIELDGYLVGTSGSNPAELYLVGTSDTAGKALVIPAKLTQN